MKLVRKCFLWKQFGHGPEKRRAGIKLGIANKNLVWRTTEASCHVTIDRTENLISG